MNELNKDILTTLEFNQVKSQIVQHLVTDQGKEELQRLVPVKDKLVITSYLEETDDAMKVLRLRGGIPIPKVENIQPHMKRIEIGADLNGVEL
ncbi:MAG: endonuclease MutS2, partial [Tetragenococcus koreensis]